MFKDTLNLIKRYFKPLFNERGEVIAPFLDSVSEDVKAPISSFVEASGIPNEELAKFKDVGEFFNAYGEKQKAAQDQQKPWFDNLPEEFKSDPSINKYKSPEEFAKGHQNLAKLVGSKGVIIPKDDAPQEEKDRFFEALGRPKDAKEYKLVVPDKLHPEIKITPQSEELFKGAAYKLGLTNAQAAQLNQWYLSSVSAALQSRDKVEMEQVKKAETALRAEWGADYDKKLSMSIRMVEKFGGKDAIDAFGNLGNNPVVLKTIANMAAKFSEDSIDRFGVESLTVDAQGAKQKIAEIQSAPRTGDNAHPYWNENHPKHQEAVKEMTKLFEIAHGGDNG
jgi:hypothetical protein